MEVLLSDTDSMPDLESIGTFSNKEINELAELTTFPMELLFEGINSIPDLESILGSGTSEESIIFVFTPSNAIGTEDSEKGSIDENIDMFSDEEIIELTIDQGEEALTTFYAAMLVNVDGFGEGTQTELYNSGALRHMSPYRDHFKNYAPIIPKLITAVDKRYFQAIGKGDLQIKIPNGTGTTTVLLKYVLHCPDMGLTLVSIGKITAAGYKVIFRGLTCRIYDCKDKIIGQINARNGLYRVDHEIMVNAAMSGQP
jgi:hypothetical protein